ncbi:hypothetical protein ABIA38_001045 [Embleya sp. AB8]
MALNGSALLRDAANRLGYVPEGHPFRRSALRGRVSRRSVAGLSWVEISDVREIRCTAPVFGQVRDCAGPGLRRSGIAQVRDCAGQAVDTGIRCTEERAPWVTTSAEFRFGWVGGSWSNGAVSAARGRVWCRSSHGPSTRGRGRGEEDPEAGGGASRTGRLDPAGADRHAEPGGSVRAAGRRPGGVRCEDRAAVAAPVQRTGPGRPRRPARLRPQTADHRGRALTDRRPGQADSARPAGNSAVRRVVGRGRGRAAGVAVGFPGRRGRETGRRGDRETGHRGGPFPGPSTDLGQARRGEPLAVVSGLPFPSSWPRNGASGLRARHGIRRATLQRAGIRGTQIRDHPRITTARRDPPPRRGTAGYHSRATGTTATVTARTITPAPDPAAGPAQWGAIRVQGRSRRRPTTESAGPAAARAQAHRQPTREGPTAGDRRVASRSASSRRPHPPSTGFPNGTEHPSRIP